MVFTQSKPEKKVNSASSVAAAYRFMEVSAGNEAGFETCIPVVYNKRRYSGIPIQVKVLVCLALLIAAISMSRMDPIFRSYFHNTLAPNHRADGGDSGLIRAFRPFQLVNIDLSSASMPQRRVVFLEDSVGSKGTPNNRIIHDSSFQSRLNYPLKPRTMWNSFPDSLFETSSDSENDDGSLDLTRLYPLTDSKDLPKMERRQWPTHDFDPHCVPCAKWQSSFYPVCNDVHAGLDIRHAFVDQDLSLLSNKGFWRNAWKYDVKPSVNSTAFRGSNMASVWKTFKIGHNFEEKYYEDNRVDAVAMERLTASPFIIRVYGFCGLTVVQELASKDLAQVVDGGRKMNSTEKLHLAKQIAMGVAAIHSIRGDDEGDLADTRTALVHNDINMANLMFTADGRPIINDFNIAKLLMKHNETGKTCRFYSSFPNPQWKAPEEQVLDGDENLIGYHPPIVDEKIDVYAMGNIFFRIVVGWAPWKRPEAERLYPEEKPLVARLKKHNGTLPAIPSTILVEAKKDKALFDLLSAMRLCYRFDPKKRPTAAEIVEFLDSAISRHVVV